MIDYHPMILEEFYLSDPDSLKKAVDITGLDEEDIIRIVGGYFRKNSRWAGKLKGKIVVTDNYIFIKKSFGGKTLWKINSDDYIEGGYI